MDSEHENFEIVNVQAGVRSLRSRACGETFHPVVGPMAEARSLHVIGQRLVARASEVQPLIIWDVGLGAAANAIAVLEALRGRSGELHSFDETTEPLAFALRHADELEYPLPHANAIEALLATGCAQIGEVHWQLHAGDFASTMHAANISAPHALLYDPYSPATNPALWTLEHFTQLRARLDPARPCLLTNYTRSTAVRVTLLLAGFFVGRGEATGEKEETTAAATHPELLSAPLESLWLDRVARSTKGAPLRIGGRASPIGVEDFARLRAHPQFSS